MSVLLVSLPGTYPSFPAVGLEIVAHGLRARGHAVRLVYGHLDIVAHVGGTLLRTLCRENVWDLLYAHWVYPEARVGLRSGRVVKMLTDPADDFRFSEHELAATARGLARFNRDMARKLAALPPPSLVGFGVQNNQLLAAAYFARIAKQLWGDRVPVIVGGASVRDGLGRSILARHPEFDFVSEAHGVEEIDRIVRSTEPAGLPRLTVRGAAGRRGSESTGIDEPAESDVTYGDFYRSRAAFDAREDLSVFHPWDGIPAMLAIGCRWGRCRFCNLRDRHAAHAPSRVVDSIERRAAMAGVPKAFLVDLSQPDRPRLHRFFRELEGRSARYLFGAMCRCDIGRDDLIRFRQNGLDVCHLGIESYSDPLLKRMNKGVGVIDIAEVLIACAECGVRVEGNLIVNLPWEEADDVRETGRNLSLLSHLPLPRLIDFKLSHGSIVFGAPKTEGESEWVAEPVVRYAYPRPMRASLESMYYTRRQYRLRHQGLWLEVIRKYESYARNPPSLCYERFADGMVIHDGRDVAGDRRFLMHGRGTADVYQYCRKVRTRGEIRRHFADTPAPQLAAALAAFVSRKVMIQSGDRFLSLALERAGDVHRGH